MNALDMLMKDLTPEQRAQVEGQKPRAKRATRSTAGTPDEAWTRANDLESADVGDWLGLRDGGSWKCPGCESLSGFDPVRGGFKCLHDRCQSRGKEGFLSTIDMVAELHGVTPAEAVNELAERFHFEPLPPLQTKPTNGSGHAEWTHGSSAGDDYLPPLEDSDPGEPPPGMFEDEPEKKASAVTWLSAADIFAPLPPTKWIVPDLQLGPGRPTLLAAYGASGKSMITQSLALSIAAAAPVWNHFPTARGVVRHFDHEQGKHATSKRYQRLCAGMGLDGPDFDGHLFVAILPELYLTSKNAVDAYCRECEGSTLVILDAFRGAIPGLDENDSRVRICIDNLTRVSEKVGCAFWLLHHAGKPKDGHSDQRTIARGSSAIFDACGAVWNLTGAKGSAKVMSQQKTPAEAEGRPVDDFQLVIDDVLVGTNPTGGVAVTYEPVVSSDPDDQAKRQRLDRTQRLETEIRELLERKPEIKSAETIAKELGRRLADVNLVVKAMIDTGEVVATGSTTNRRLRYAGRK
jgi:hypothetical protein